MLKAAIIALRNKLYSPARWVLGLSALIWLAVSFYLLCTSHYSIAAIFLAWAILHFISWAIFDRRRIFALGFGVLASGLYLQVAGIKVYSWGSKPPYYLQIIDVACCVLVVIFLLAWAAHIGSWAEQRRKDQPLEWKPWVGYWHEGNYPAWLLALGFVRSKKWRGWSITAGILGAIYWTCASGRYFSMDAQWSGARHRDRRGDPFPELLGLSSLLFCDSLGNTSTYRLGSTAGCAAAQFNMNQLLITTRARSY